MDCLKPLRIGILLLTLFATSLAALELHHADRDLLLLREARPWLQDHSDGLEIMPFDLIGGGTGVQLRHDATLIHLFPDSLLLIEQTDDESLVVRLLHGRVSFDTVQTLQVVVRASDLRIDVTGTAGEIRLIPETEVLVEVSRGIASATREARTPAAATQLAQIANPRRALQYNVEQALFTSVPVNAAARPVPGPAHAAGRAFTEERLGRALEEFDLLYGEARANRDRFDDAFERDRAGRATDDMAGYGAHELWPALEASYRVFPLFYELLGAGMLRDALMRRVAERPAVAGADSRERSVIDRLGVFVERFSELAYQARISGPYPAPDENAGD